MKIKKIVKFIFKYLLIIIPLKNYILFESFPDFSDSTIYVYKQLKKLKYDRKYKFIWLKHNIKKNNILFASLNKIKQLYYINISKYIICNNSLITIQRKGQKVVYIAHGEATKKVKNYYSFKGNITAFFNLSPYFKKTMSDQFNVPQKKIYSLGLPRNDAIIASKINLRKILGFYGKIVFYYPTVKQWNNGMIHGLSSSLGFLFKNNYNRLNIFLKEYNIMLIIKNHWASIDSSFTTLKYSNILLIDDSFFKKHRISSYQCLAKSDALLTDYSSVFYDYLLLNKQIGFVWTDFNDYLDNPGLVNDFVNFSSKCGFKIKSSGNLFNFLKNVVNNNDLCKKQREKIKSIIHPYRIKSSSRRVTSKIIELFNL